MGPSPQTPPGSFSSAGGSRILLPREMEVPETQNVLIPGASVPRTIPLVSFRLGSSDPKPGCGRAGGDLGSSRRFPCQNNPADVTTRVALRLCPPSGAAWDVCTGEKQAGSVLCIHGAREAATWGYGEAACPVSSRSLQPAREESMAGIDGRKAAFPQLALSTMRRWLSLAKNKPRNENKPRTNPAAPQARSARRLHHSPGEPRCGARFPSDNRAGL